MQSATILDIATNGTDQQVTQLYQRLTGKNITGCLPCQKGDARIELRIMAKKAQLVEDNQPVGGWKVADAYLGKVMFDRPISVETPNQVEFWLRKAPYVLEPAAAAAVIVEPTPTNGDTETNQ
jgi:hypothetical protein